MRIVLKRLCPLGLPFLELKHDEPPCTARAMRCRFAASSAGASIDWWRVTQRLYVCRLLVPR